MADFDIGDVVRMSAEFRDSASVLVNPTTVTCTVKKPDGTTATATVVNDGTGLRHADFTAVLAGEHHYRWLGTGSNAGSEEGTFFVRVSEVI